MKKKNLLGMATAWVFVFGSASTLTDGAQAASYDLTPKAFYAFCSNNPGQCSSKGARNAVADMDQSKWSQLRSVNSKVNRAIQSRTDQAIHGRVDVWSIAASGQYGDCEDYALTKRSKLLAMGWPSSALLVTTARTGSGEGHAVLTVRTSEGNYILDNRTSAIKKARHTGYRFYTMQSPSNPRKWVAIPRSGPVADTSVRIASKAKKAPSQVARKKRVSPDLKQLARLARTNIRLTNTRQADAGRNSASSSRAPGSGIFSAGR